jgi:hypothetical protein
MDKPYYKLAVLLIGLVLVGCASAKSQQTSLVDRSEIARPGTFLIYDFDTGTQTQTGRALAASFSNEVVAALRSQGINAIRAFPSTTTPQNAFQAKGQFVTIDPGSAGKRVVVGFGSGAEEVSVQFTVYQVTPEGPRPLAEITGKSQGGKSPGMATSAGVAVATSNPTGLVIGGVLNTKREIKDPIQESFKRLAKDLAARARKFYREQGWL